MSNPLTNREPEVRMFTMEGLGSIEVAHKLRFSIRTVDTHCNNIFEKPEVHNKTWAIFEAPLINLLEGSRLSIRNFQRAFWLLHNSTPGSGIAVLRQESSLRTIVKSLIRLCQFFQVVSISESMRQF